ncbi:MAG: formate dehydrogenase subunit gamma, partial [Alcaligenaceae bacterium]|nr:formate dehydrogenase subunit gamma [Alcaligenaceae bacterium]
RTQPAGTHVLRICRAESCQAKGGEALAGHARQALGCDFHTTSDDGAVTLEPVYCLGLCAQSPAIMLDGEPHGHVTPEKLERLVDAARADDSCSQQASRPAAFARGTAQPEEQAAEQKTQKPGQVILYVPCDAAALAAGADAVARAVEGEAAARGLPVTMVRNGSRGMLWLETLVEVATPQGRVAYGPVRAEDVPGLFDAGWLQGGAHPLCHGLTEDIPYLKNQERLTFARVGLTDPLSLEDYAAHGGWSGLQRALSMPPAQIVEAVTQSGLRGRGGAAFPTGLKWQTVLQTAARQKYVVCNADEGDSGTFADRMLMEGDPYALIEGMAIAGLAVGATQGYIYVRSEYPHAIAALNAAIERAGQAGWLGENLQGSGQRFMLEVRKGAGAYICGEETSLLNSLEGKRGVVRAKPPLPAIEGLFGQPTVVNNVLSLATVPLILDKGATYYRDFGMGRSLGTQPFQLAGNLKRGGLVEKAFGITLRELLYDYGGGSASGRPLRAVQAGGPLGAYLPESQWDIPMDYESYAAAGAMIGHGGLVAFDDTVNLLGMSRYAMEFCAI